MHDRRSWQKGSSRRRLFDQLQMSQSSRLWMEGLEEMRANSIESIGRLRKHFDKNSEEQGKGIKRENLRK